MVPVDHSAVVQDLWARKDIGRHVAMFFGEGESKIVLSIFNKKFCFNI
jgi:hypothetical protein